MAKSKSAYSTPSKLGKIDTHIIVVWVDNEASVLSRVVGLFSGRGYNIESLAVAEIDHKKNLSRITIVTTGTPQVIEQIVLQLKKLVPVHNVANFKREDKKVIFKEMALLKIVANSIKIKKALITCKKYNDKRGIVHSYNQDRERYIVLLDEDDIKIMVKEENLSYEVSVEDAQEEQETIIQID